jgi:hypothetical protein
MQARTHPAAGCYSCQVARPSRRASLLPLGACWLAVAALQGCGGSDRPSAFDNYIPTQSPRGDTGPSGLLSLDASVSVPMCNLGPEGGVCACADEPLAGDIPNLYFVLDRSGSMAELNKWVNIQLELANLIVALGPRASVGAAVFPNPLADSCATGIEVFPPHPGDVPAGTPGPIEAELITVLSEIPASGGTPTASTLTSLLPRLTSLPGKTYAILATDGGPNCNASATCTADQCTDNIEGDLGCIPGGPVDCCADPSYGGGLACLDAQPTIDAVTQIAQAGIPVYVIGVPGSAPYAALLDDLAQAGGTGRGSEPQYYAIDSADQAALHAVLSSIAAKITGSCTIALGNAPPDPGLVNVFFDENALPQAGPDGWAIEGATVTITGASCQKILDGDVLDVRVVAGCPTVLF